MGGGGTHRVLKSEDELVEERRRHQVGKGLARVPPRVGRIRLVLLAVENDGALHTRVGGWFGWVGRQAVGGSGKDANLLQEAALAWIDSSGCR